MNNQKKIIPVFIVLVFALMFFNTIQAQQTTTVTGKVADAYTGAPLAGVTVQVKGENVTVQTEKDGTYNIDVPKAGKTLILSAGGYQALQVDIEDRQVINVVMTQDVANDPSLW
jgi:hypothetical protein